MSDETRNVTMNCLCCGQQIRVATCSHCGYTLKEGDSIVSLFELDIDKINSWLKSSDALFIYM
jgi:hypothetical protein